MSTTSQIITVEMISTYFIPNTFTPNRDSINEYFSIIGHGISPDNFEMDIFNRWGSLIYSTKDVYAPWDGTVSGNAVPDGTYVYIITFKIGNSTEIIKKVGNVNVFR
jgi:gliding motility-associated-like protein